jgi:hypothetical protein
MLHHQSFILSVPFPCPARIASLHLLQHLRG